MNKIKLSLAAMVLVGVSSAHAVEIPFEWNYRMEGPVIGVVAKAIADNKTACLIAVNDLHDNGQSKYYHYSETSEACATAKMALMTGQSVYLWAKLHNGGDNNPQAIAVEITKGDVRWRVAPEEV